jgi:hypothetical protein
MRQPKVHTKLGRAAVQIFAANDRTNQYHADSPGRIFSLDRIMQKEVEKYEDTAQKTAPNMPHLLPAAAK